jgi:hypothetical protein
MDLETRKELTAKSFDAIADSIDVYSANRAEEYRVHLLGTQQSLGLIKDRSNLPKDAGIDEALGLREQGDEVWLGASPTDGAQEAARDGGQIILRSKDALGRVHSRVFDPKHHWAQTEYSVVEPSGFKSCEFISNSFAPVEEGLELPSNITEKEFYVKNGKILVFKTLSMTNIVYTVSDPLNVAARYLMVWPKGARVLDERIHKEFLIQSGDRTLSDPEEYKLLGGVMTTKPSSDN